LGKKWGKRNNEIWGFARKKYEQLCHQPNMGLPWRLNKKGMHTGMNMHSLECVSQVRT
jgi:hypothetical protein